MPEGGMTNKQANKHTNKKKSKKTIIITMEHEDDGVTNCDKVGTIPKCLVKGWEHLEIKGQVEIILSIALLRSVKILKRVLETLWDLLSLKLQWKFIS